MYGTTISLLIPVCWGSVLIASAVKTQIYHRERRERRGKAIYYRTPLRPLRPLR